MDTTEPAKANGKPYIPGRQRGKIPDEEWAEIQAYRRSLAKQLADVEAAIKREEQELRDGGPNRGPAIFGYIRCSHQDSKDSGLGEEGQRRIIERWATLVKEERGINGDIRWFHEPDAVSAFKVPLILRNQGSELNMALRDGDHVIFAYLDRVFRNTEDCLGTIRTWRARGITVHFANLHVDANSAMGEFLITGLAAGARMESALKSERNKEICNTFEALGRLRNGHAPMGFKLVGHKVRGKWIHATIAPDPEQRRIMGEIMRVRDKYGWPFDKIGDYIDEWLAETEGQKRTPRWEREWSSQRCRRAYNVEVALRKEATSQPPSASS